MEIKTVLITGATSGIGKACACKFAKEGWNLILNARDTSKLEKLIYELEMECPKLVTRPLICDVRDREQVKAALENLPADWKTIDLLINNAGLVIGVDKEFEGSLDEWDIMIDTNIKGLLTMTRLVVPGMIERGRGLSISGTLTAICWSCFAPAKTSCLPGCCTASPEAWRPPGNI